MRVLYVISELTFGGAQKQVVELARELSQCGHEVVIYTLNNDVPRRPELEGSGVTLVIDQKRSRLDPALLWRLRRTVVRWRPDIVHSFLFDADFYSRVAALGTGIPVLNSERSHDYRLAPLARVAHRLTRRLARGVVANSHSGRDFAQRLFGLPPDDVHVVWNGLRLEDLERQAASERDYRAEFFGGDCRMACLVGSIKPAKDYRLALDTADRLIGSHPEWRVLLIGDRLSASGDYKPGRDSDSGAYKESILAHYRQLAARDRIRFAGLRTDVPAIVRQCDLLYITSAHEGSPNVVLEAMALGVPVVSTEYSDIRRVLPFREQVARERSPEALCRAMLWAHENRERIAVLQKQWVQAHARIEQVARELERVYRKYAGARVSAQPA